MIKNKCDWCDQYLIIKEVEKLIFKLRKINNDYYLKMEKIIKGA